MIPNIIAILCTVLMIGAVIWITLFDHKNTNDDEKTNGGDK